jgi:hypothetical protein
VKIRNPKQKRHRSHLKNSFTSKFPFGKFRKPTKRELRRWEIDFERFPGDKKINSEAQN